MLSWLRALTTRAARNPWPLSAEARRTSNVRLTYRTGQCSRTPRARVATVDFLSSFLLFRSGVVSELDPNPTSYNPCVFHLPISKNLWRRNGQAITATRTAHRPILTSSTSHTPLGARQICANVELLVPGMMGSLVKARGHGDATGPELGGYSTIFLILLAVGITSGEGTNIILGFVVPGGHMTAPRTTPLACD
ncbi:hypothetical protein EDB83DRAFT_1586550 [Lactarius deliciosus]|nr:hypothetical protein EDB83DRAFT_1586550 [Lactarius deliciosus]